MDAVLRDHLPEDALRTVVSDQGYGASDGGSPLKEKKKEMKLVRVIEEKKLEQERDIRVKQAFTFGLKLKGGLPDRYKLFECLSRI